MGLFYSLFLVYSKNIITIFTTNICEKCPSSIGSWDLNPRPLEHESPPVTTRPGLPPFHTLVWQECFNEEVIIHLSFFQVKQPCFKMQHLVVEQQKQLSLFQKILEDHTSLLVTLNSQTTRQARTSGKSERNQLSSVVIDKSWKCGSHSLQVASESLLTAAMQRKEMSHLATEMGMTIAGYSRFVWTSL